MQTISVSLLIVAVPIVAPGADLAAGRLAIPLRQGPFAAAAGLLVSSAVSTFQPLGFVLDQVGCSALVL